MLLPDFPWDSLAAAREIAAGHPQGIVDLSVGTPVDPTPPLVRAALCEAADAPGYPTTHGTDALRESIADWLLRRRSVTVDPTSILPVIGTKELVAWLPTMLGISGDVVFPSLAYPTYEVGAILAGARPVRSDGALLPEHLCELVWLNTPANPNGSVLSSDELRQIVRWVRAAHEQQPEGAPLVVSDECYAGLDWTAPAPSLLDDAITGGDHRGLLMVHSLSKRSNMAGYRFGFVAGDPELIARLLHVGKHAGMIVPSPVQAAAAAAYRDDAQAEAQRDRYAMRREVLIPALEGAGFRIDDSQGGLYLWATRGRPCRETVDELARLGILVAPGEFYGPGGEMHVRVALTATDERVHAAAQRLLAQ